MYEPASKNNQTVQVECHDGCRAAEYPKRVCLNGAWHEIFEIVRREVIEDFASRERSNVYYCHIGDNIIVKLIRNKAGWTKA